MKVRRPVMKLWKLIEGTPTSGPEDLASTLSSAADGMTLGETFQPHSLSSYIYKMKN